MTRNLDAKTRLTFESNDARLMIKGCVMLSNFLLEMIGGEITDTEKIEILCVFLEATEEKIVQLDNTCEEVEHQS